MSTARKYAFKGHSMAPEARSRAYAAINISWKNMRPDLHCESKEIIREEMLIWIASFLGLKALDSIKDLKDAQIGLVLDEMRRLTGARPAAPAASSGNVISLANYKRPQQQPAVAEVVHLTSEEQYFTLEKIVKFIGWTEEQTADFLRKRKFAPSLRMLTFKKANALMMILLNIAADKDLRRLHDRGAKITRKMTAEHLPHLKRKLQIKS